MAMVTLEEMPPASRDEMVIPVIPVGVSQGEQGQQKPSAAENDADAEARGVGAPDSFFCPVGMCLMRDPVMIETGHTCESPHAKILHLI